MYKSKQSRLLCLLFAFILCFQSFGLGVSAASDNNLIDSNLSTWSNWSDYFDGAATLTVSQGDDIYRVTASSPDGAAYLGALFGDSSLIAGHSYSLSFRLPGRTEVNTAFNKDYSSNVFQGHFSQCYVSVGVGYLTSSGDFISPEQMLCFEINPDNYAKYFGQTLKASFIASNYSGTPVLYISISSLNNENHSFYFSDFKLVDNDDNSSELTGIKGFLHSIRWDLVGGTCEEEDCPHSSGDNPHLSLSERMSSGFASMFQTIGDKFEEGSTLNVWFNGLSDKVGSINGSLSSLGDRINGFFSGLGDRISGFFSNLGDRMSGFFTNLGSSIGGFFSDLKTNMSNWFSELGSKITTKFQEIGDKFSEFFDKFKPRVTLNLNWVRGSIDSSGDLIIDESSDRVIVTELFEVPSGSVYYSNFTVNAQYGITRVVFVPYDLSGNYIGANLSYTRDFEALEVPSGFQYRAVIFLNPGLAPEVVNDFFYVYAEEGWLNAVLWNMKMGLKVLFVPDERAITDLKTDLDNLLRDHLGIIYTCSELFTDTLNLAFDIITEAPDTYQIKIPEVSFDVGGTTVPVFSSQNIDFSFMEKPVFKTMYGMYTVALYFFFGALEVKYALRVYRKVMNN